MTSDAFSPRHFNAPVGAPSHSQPHGGIADLGVQVDSTAPGPPSSAPHGYANGQSLHYFRGG